VATSEEFGQDTVQKFDFARRSHDLLVYHTTWTDDILDALEQERMLADFAELHEFVAEALDST
jgi:hypothetical protein